MSFAESDRVYMQRALELAAQGLGRVSPNPPVGCVLVRDGTVVGEGWHERFGGPHAEVNALQQAGSQARGATVYVTLMPCAHTGKTPPCTSALIEAGVARVVAALTDPNPQSGDGRAQLTAAGIRVDEGLLAADAAYVARGFLKCLATGLPFVAYKYAMTLDGKTATRSGSSQWISGEAARADVQRVRAQQDAVMVGIGTALADDPRLTVREEARPQPRRVVVDSTCRLTPEARLFQAGDGGIVVLTTQAAESDRIKALEAAGATVVRVGGSAARVDLRAGLESLTAMGIRMLLCEGGARLAGGLLDAGLMDEVMVYLAPKIAGGSEAPSAIGGLGVPTMDDAHPVRAVTLARLGDDMRLHGRIGDWSWSPAVGG